MYLFLGASKKLAVNANIRVCQITTRIGKMVEPEETKLELMASAAQDIPTPSLIWRMLMTDHASTVHFATRTERRLKIQQKSSNPEEMHEPKHRANAKLLPIPHLNPIHLCFCGIKCSPFNTWSNFVKYNRILHCIIWQTIEICLLSDSDPHRRARRTNASVGWSTMRILWNIITMVNIKGWGSKPWPLSLM